MQRRTLLITTGLAVPGILAPRHRAAAQGGAADVPDRPVTIVVPFAAGGPTDTVTRLVAEAMGRDLGQTVVVENVTGAGGTIGAARVANARPDGATLLMHHIGHATAATLYRRLPYNVQTSFEPIGLVTEVPVLVTAHPGFPAETLPELLAVMRRDGERLNLANAGIGGSDQLAGLLLMRAAGAKVTEVSFRGTAPALTELIAGRVDLYCGQATGLVPAVRDRQIRAYAVTTARRLTGPGLGDIPTVVELGQPELQVSVWHALYAPRGTPPAMVQRFSRALQAALRDPKVVERFADLVTEPVAPERATPEAHRQFLAAEVARWRPIIQAAGVYAD
ncbi:tripartite tricarboxylate transporter substrate-binding protein [Roseomonas sp. NAR14]|uniref:Tripartite tricarboxylate transporter substrate-binding protein n=1 Tax=Roseomonas acroporae TaxID=2937791 RepID=A0A9X2BT22_9PROT|nr:tripartite tricarboxylate transporter substrate-binding protein [Roseomonas acroporae]MCK8782831.1 tripartite tricarboxylate transporter substrate-binding protein [Roseomonas acroporae]